MDFYVLGQQDALEKYAVVRRDVKDFRRASVMKATGSHDFHQTEARRLPSILEEGVTPSVGHLGRAGYFGAGAPAKGYEPTAHMPAVAVARGSPDVVKYQHPRHGADTYALYRDPVQLQPKDYAVIHREGLQQNPEAYKELLRRIQEKRLRVLPSDTINQVFRPGKPLPLVDDLAGHSLALGLKKKASSAVSLGSSS